MAPDLDLVIDMVKDPALWPVEELLRVQYYSSVSAIKKKANLEEMRIGTPKTTWGILAKQFAFRICYICHNLEHFGTSFFLHTIYFF